MGRDTTNRTCLRWSAPGHRSFLQRIAFHSLRRHHVRSVWDSSALHPVSAAPFGRRHYRGVTKGRRDSARIGPSGNPGCHCGISGSPTAWDHGFQCACRINLHRGRALSVFPC